MLAKLCPSAFSRIEFDTVSKGGPIPTGLTGLRLIEKMRNTGYSREEIWVLPCMSAPQNGYKTSFDLYMAAQMYKQQQRNKEREMSENKPGFTATLLECLSGADRTIVGQTELGGEEFYWEQKGDKIEISTQEGWHYFEAEVNVIVDSLGVADVRDIRGKVHYFVFRMDIPLTKEILGKKQEPSPLDWVMHVALRADTPLEVIQQLIKAAWPGADPTKVMVMEETKWRLDDPNPPPNDPKREVKLVLQR